MNPITNRGEGHLPFDPDEIQIRVTRHFRTTWMLKWGWDQVDIREAFGDAYRVIYVGTVKWEILVRKKGQKKLVISYDVETKEVYVITGAEG